MSISFFIAAIVLSVIIGFLSVGLLLRWKIDTVLSWMLITMLVVSATGVRLFEPQSVLQGVGMGISLFGFAMFGFAFGILSLKKMDGLLRRMFSPHAEPFYPPHIVRECGPYRGSSVLPGECRVVRE